MKNLYLFILFLLVAVTLSAQEPAGYYSAAENKSDATLKTALFGIVGNHTAVSYDALWTAFKTTDKRADGKVWDIYSNATNYVFGTNQCGNAPSEGSCYNREHSFPKSWFNDATPMYSDLFHLYPSDGYVNNRRGNLPFGEVGSVSYSSNNNYCRLGTSNFPGYSGTVFEPADEFKGDLARTYFYMVTAYEDRVSGWNSDHLDGTKYPALNSWSVALLLKWHRNDPVSAKEINRNNVIYNNFQHNRNPFIDHPELAEYIWGDKKGQPWTINNTPVPYLSSPTTGALMDFGKTPYQQTVTKSVTIKGANLTGDLTLAVSGTNAGQFSLSATSVSQASAQAGYTLTVTYAAQALGTHNAVLTISGGGITAVTVNLLGNSTDSFIALPATNVTDNGFTANWTSSVGATDYLLNIYIYSSSGTVAKTILEEDFNVTTLPAGWSSTGYITLTESAGEVRMGSSGSNGEITTPALDLSGSANLTVKARQYVNDNGAKIYVKVDGQDFTTLTTAVAKQDFTLVISDMTSASKITLTANSKSRVYVDYVKVATEGSTSTPVSVAGYPKLTGNVLTFNVTGLQSDQTYYYTVTPQGNSAAISDEIQLKTTVATPTNNHKTAVLKWRSANNLLYLSEIPTGNQVTIYDSMGRMVKRVFDAPSDMNTSLPSKGIYLILVGTGKETNSYKILY